MVNYSPEPPTVPRESRRRLNAPSGCRLAFGETSGSTSARGAGPMSRTVLLVNDTRPPTARARFPLDSGEVATIKQTAKSRSRRREHVVQATDVFWQMVLAAFVAGIVVGVALLPALHAHLSMARAIAP